MFPQKYHHAPVRVSLIQHNLTISTFLICLIGSLLAYLCFNFNPSKLIMGDVGSLSLGAILAVVAISLNAEYLKFKIIIDKKILFNKSKKNY